MSEPSHGEGGTVTRDGWTFRHPRAAMLLYAVAMGYLEAVVVVYLRELYYPEGFSFPLKPMDDAMVAVEIGREAATVVMIFAVAWAAARSGWQTLTGFALIFGVWDIVYYVGLWLLLGWPASLFEPDVLFLIPAVWVGPVLAPALIGLSMSAAAWAMWPMEYRVIAPRAWEWALMAMAGLVLLATFIVPAASLGVTRLGEGISLEAVSYPWWGWVLGESAAVFLAVRWWMRGRGPT
ncbi:MAG: hypothetical protein VX815_04440 [Gemmatimonadota bacterium]|nr:hypothetical protein [Gemmatimonadota bacterium]